jgi:alpha-D-xyloside xylohydrolase
LSGGVIETCNDGHLLRVDAWGPDAVRVRAAPGALRDEPYALIGGPTGEPAPGGPASGAPAASETILRNGALEVELKDGKLAFRRVEADGTRTEVLAEHPAYLHFPGPRDFFAGRIEQRFRAYDGERLYGLGQHLHGRLDQKGAVVDLIQRNGEVTIPFLVSNRGYGLLWNNPAIGRVELATTFTRWVADRSPQIDYWFTLGDSPADLLARYADATGHAPEFPQWASGLWQSKLRYKTQEELVAVARECHARGIGVSAMLADFFHWPRMGDWRFDPAAWPDPAAAVKELAGLGTRLMVSVWPTVNIRSENYAELRDRGLLVLREDGEPYTFDWPDTDTDDTAPCAYLDLTQPAAADFLWAKLRDNYVSLGIDTFWIDACEPDLPNHAANTVRYAAGPGSEVGSLYPVREAQAVFAGQQSALGGRPTVNLIRSAWAGSQQYGAALWSGDIPTTFESLATQIPAGLNVGLSGYPWWNTDLGGFHGGDPTDPTFRELLVRWFQFGVFTTLLRMHGDREPRMRFFSGMTGGPNELWSYGEAYPILVEWLGIRERLRPYLHEALAEASRSGLPPMRALFLEFPDDPRCWEIGDSFLFGPDLLVAPVTEYGARTRTVYLPAAETWVDCFTGTSYAGGATVEMDAPLTRIPVLRRASSPVRLVA